MPVDEYEEMSSTVCRMQYLDKYQARILEWLREFPDLTAAQVCDWLKEHYREEVSERTVSRYVKQLREEYGLKRAWRRGNMRRCRSCRWGSRCRWTSGRR